MNTSSSSIEKTKNIPIILPSYNPTDKLLDVVAGIRSLSANPIIVVDDGSKAECDFLFKAISSVEGATVLKHAVNQGKGRALKTAFNHCLNTFSGNLSGVVTADADGQHRPADIVRCIREFEIHPDRLVLGCRCFTGKNVPWKSKVGNLLTIFAFRIFGGGKLGDTQTGLRGIPAALMRDLLSKDTGERFEFETVMLLEYRMKFPSAGCLEIPIETVYVNDNRETHFNPVVDSAKICQILIRYSIASFIGFIFSGLLSAIIDQGLFAVLYYWILSGVSEIYNPLLISVVAARSVSLLFNYSFNKQIVFSHRGRLFDFRPFVSYLLLCALVLGMSYSLLKGVLCLFPNANVLISKIIIDILLFLGNFFVQKYWCFASRKKSERRNIVF